MKQSYRILTLLTHCIRTNYLSIKIFGVFPRIIGSWLGLLWGRLIFWENACIHKMHMQMHAHSFSLYNQLRSLKFHFRFYLRGTNFSISRIHVNSDSLLRYLLFLIFMLGTYILFIHKLNLNGVYCLYKSIIWIDITI